MREDSSFIESLIGQASIFVIILLPFVLAIKLLQFALSSKQSAIFTVCMAGMFYLMFNVPGGDITITVPLETRFQDVGNVEKP